MHHRLLLVLDELHRIGFEQLRFSRSREGQRLRLQLYAASSASMQDWFFEGRGQMLCLSDDETWANFESRCLGFWAELLAGDLKPRHLAGRFVLEFPDLVRPAYAADHKYREWFRQLRPLMQGGYLPITWSENPYGNQPDFNLHIVMSKIDTETLLLPRPPANRFARPHEE